ncbi:MAG: hypothetical protein LBV55_02670 [Acholeplasmatales bacterium]|jgi:hypothetical protein|nr:hypothetical protein [Acholeplasmatales bacterium]
MAIILNTKIKEKLGHYFAFTKSLSFFQGTDLKDLYFESLPNDEQLALFKDNKFKIKYLAIKDTYQLSTNAPDYEILIKNYLNFCQKNNIANLIIPMFDYADFLQDLPQITQLLNNLYLLEKKTKINLIIKPNFQNDLNIFHTLTNSVKTLKLFYSLEEMYLHNQSIVTNYRLLKNYLAIIEINDLNEKNTPELLGYGALEIIEFFKKLNRDKYEGDILYTCNIYDLYKNSRKTNKFMAFFHPKRVRLRSSLQDKLDLNNQDYAFDDLFLNQIKILKIMVKNL